MREKLKQSYSETRRLSIDPELLLRIMLIGYLYGITTESDQPGIDLDHGTLPRASSTMVNSRFTFPAQPNWPPALSLGLGA